MQPPFSVRSCEHPHACADVALQSACEHVTQTFATSFCGDVFVRIGTQPFVTKMGFWQRQRLVIRKGGFPVVCACHGQSATNRAQQRDPCVADLVQSFAETKVPQETIITINWAPCYPVPTGLVSHIINNLDTKIVLCKILIVVP